MLIHYGAGGLPVGFAVVRQNALLLLCVQPEYRNRGVGSALLERAEALMRPYGRAVLGHAQDTYIFPGVPMDGGPMRTHSSRSAATATSGRRTT